MANGDTSWLPKSSSPSELQLNVRGMPFGLDRGLLAAKSAKVAALLKENPRKNLAFLLQDIPADPETIELVARFCHGFEMSLSAENVIPLICLAHYLEMTESHSNHNLLQMTLTFLEQRVLPSWNETIKAFRSATGIFRQAVDLGLVDACLDSFTEKALADPQLLGEPIADSMYDEDSEDEEEVYRPSARRKLFALDWKPEDLTTLSPQLYEPIIHAMNQRGVPSKYVAASLFQYLKKWVFPGSTGGETESIYKKNSRRNVMEAVERLLPREKRLLPCALLFEMLRFAISLECSNDCRSGFESRIGKQLDQATVKDLLIPSQGYAKEVQYDIECVRRILTHFYANYSSTHVSGLISVADLMEEFLTEVASDRDLKTDTFVSLAEMSVAASSETHKNSDGIYRAIDIYLDKHRYLTQPEREEVCRVLDCQKMSPEACEHAAKNERLPVRFVVQVLFMAQLQLRDTIAKEVQVFDDKQGSEEAGDEEAGNEGKMGSEEEVARIELEKMSIKVMELERECGTLKKEIKNGCIHHNTKKAKGSMWSQMKRKFGCMSSIHDCNCQVKKKKVHPKY